MKDFKIYEPEVFFDLKTGEFISEKIIYSKKELKDLSGVFKEEDVRLQMDQSCTVYEVGCYFPVADGKKGGLFWGVTRIFPGKVGEEYFMTRGHFHAEPDTAEFYFGISGEGILLCMDEEGNSWAENMRPNSLHYIAGCIAHRVANTKDEPLVFGACWPSDAGHDYETINKKGFSARLMEREGKSVLIKS